MAKYRKKPVVIEAIKFNGNNEAHIVKFIGEGLFTGEDTKGNKFMEIPTKEGTMRASVGDYIIKGIQGEFYPCKPDIFEQTYDLVEEGD